MDISRQALVDTAVGMFGEAGWDGIGPQTLVRRLGVAPGAVYRHFKSRDALLAAVLSRVQEELFVHFLVPLLAEVRGRDDEDAPPPFRPLLRDDQPGFDGLSQSHFIREQRAF